MMMLVPEAWQNDPLMPQEKKDFYMMASCLVRAFIVVAIFPVRLALCPSCVLPLRCHMCT